MEPQQLHKIKMLMAVIETEFDSVVDKQTDITVYMTNHYRWSSHTTHRYMKYLVNNRILDLEVVKSSKKPGFRNSYRLIKSREKRDEFLDKLIRQDLAGEK